MPSIAMTHAAVLELPCLKVNICFFSQQTRARAGDLWPVDRPDGMPVIQSLEVMCGKDHMDVHLTFSHPFEGIVSSKGELSCNTLARYCTLVLLRII